MLCIWLAQCSAFNVNIPKSFRFVYSFLPFFLYVGETFLLNIDSTVLLIHFVLQARGAGRDAGQRFCPAGDKQPVRRERLCQHQRNGWIHNLILHAAWQVTLLYSSLESHEHSASCCQLICYLHQMWTDGGNRIRKRDFKPSLNFSVIKLNVF